MSDMEQIIEGGFPRINVKQSSIHGTGVYAAEPIAKGRHIIEYVGEKITKEEGDKRAEATSDYTFILILNHEWDIDGSVGGNDSRFINHSCSPNTDVFIENDSAWIVAIRDIKEGEELTFDYDFEKDDKPVQCKCGSPDCREYIVRTSDNS